ncbi:MAG TPA: NfeD family protein [Opitutaceae bacterium]|nr:NfeD family protein [Opitutaceae bacterium]
MQRLILALFCLLAPSVFAAHVAAPAGGPEAPLVLVQKEDIAASAEKPVRVVVIPVRDEIGKPILYLIRRGLKMAGKDDLVVLDMRTPGGSLGAALEIMEALDKFDGHTATYVNDEAISAGALIASATDDIYFAPKGMIGAAAAVLSGGAEIPETMRLKVNSVLEAKVGAYTEGKRFRAEVITAMFDKDFELKIGEKIVKPKGKLLSLTATQAAELCGDPPSALLSSGTAKTIEGMLDDALGRGRYRLERLNVTWAERFAQYLVPDMVRTVLIGLGILCLYIEFKTPGFGFFGISGGALLLLVFFSSYIAGLSGYEAALVFAVGLLLLLTEIVFFPGVIVMAVTGSLMMFGALLWSMVDHWPNQPIELSGDMFVQPATNLLLGVALAVVLALAFAKFIPKGWFFSRLAVAGEAGSTSQVSGLPPEEAARAGSLVGAHGVVATGLFPGGQIEIDGRRYEARLELGTAVAGTPVVVVGVSDFRLIVEVEKL